MLLVVTASYGIGKTIGVYQNRRVEDIYELLIFVRMANGHLAYSASEITEIIREGSDKAGGRIGDLDRQYRKSDGIQLSDGCTDWCGKRAWKMAVLYGYRYADQESEAVGAEHADRV